MRLLRLSVLICAALSCLAAASAMAADKVEARIGKNDGYTRLAFEWPQPPNYSLSKDGDRLMLRFARAADLSAPAGTGTNVRKIETLSGPGEPLQLAVTIPSGSRFRDFIVGNKMIVDIYDSADAPPAKSEAAPEQPEPAPAKPVSAEKTAEEKPAPAKAAAPTEKTAAEKTVAEKPAETKPATRTEPKGDFSREAAESAKPAPVDAVESSVVKAPPVAPHALTLTTVTNIGVASFERNGYVWMVVDTPGLQAGPQLTGPQKAQFGEIEKLEIENGAAYRVALPEGVHARGEGGGLSWRLVLSQDGKAPDAPAPISESGTLTWPLKNMRKVLTVTDPDVGDEITIVTASRADETAGRPRSFVNLDTLHSVVGLAYTAKSDDVTAKVALDHVAVTRPAGLVLSDPKDAAPSKIRAAIEDEKAAAPAAAPDEKPPAATNEDHASEDGQHKAADALEEPGDAHDGDAHGETGAEQADDKHAAHGENAHEENAHGENGAAPHDSADHHDVPSASKDDITKAAAEKPAGNNIYNFARWELGGIQALENNQHVLMLEIANKPEDDRTADILTMVKLLLANDRGPEALGMLRIALQKVPELKGTPEFDSLTAAALALSGKFDEAIDDFSENSLKDFDDIKYWRAYTLGGLEDWRQAGQIMPKDMTPIASYPKPLKTRLALMFAEVALRNGRLNEANAILDLLRPDLGTLPLGYASSWNYLAGEAARQGGNAKEAEEYWQKLVKGGKDDLFRAKAGLSLTKLQLDNKQIKPADAIDRLEGLRYAWRGDELETLINYRLGQIYLDNKDYLKGLTVLRNASTMTPGLQVGRDVEKTMTSSFRDVFVNDRLKEISPLEAISLYEEFKDLSPPGEEADQYVDRLAERLVDADLLGRAAALLDYQVNNRLKGARKVDTAIRLAAIRLLDGNPDGALRALEVAQGAYDKIGAPVPAATEAAKPENLAPEAGEAAVPAAASPPETQVAPVPGGDVRDPEKQRQILLLRARALSMKKKPDEAIAILDQMEIDPDVSRLRTDIAWSAGKWEEAAMALDDLIVDEDISAKRPLTEYQRDLILNRGIALNLSNDRVALANLRERFNAQMKGTTKGQMFEVITRPRRPDMIGSREAIESMISEIDLFSGFLDGYAKLDGAKPDAKEPAAAKEPVPPKEPVAADASKPATGPGADKKSE